MLCRCLAVHAEADAGVTAVQAAVAQARQALARDAGALWGRRIDTVPWLFVEGQRVLMTADPHQPGYAAGPAGLWSGPLPAGVAPANTRLAWAGRTWAMVLLPLPDDAAAATRLLIHEAWHAVQPDLLPLPPLGETGPGSALLDQPEGRLWLQLEWRALAQALAAQAGSAAEATAAGHALQFRARRYALASVDERTRERLLDLSEGLAEYTAFRLTGATGSALGAHVRADAAAAPSFVRTFPYYTGPAYAYLLDRRGPGWIRRLPGTLDLQKLLTEALPGPPSEPAAPAALAALAERAGRDYGLDELRRREQVRWRAHRRQLAALRARFVDGPTLRLRPGRLDISFDFRANVSLGDAGTVMQRLVWKLPSGAELSAPDGALVLPDWSELRIPLEQATFHAGVLARPERWHTAGWTLALPAGWTLRRDGASWLATPPR